MESLSLYCFETDLFCSIWGLQNSSLLLQEPVVCSFLLLCVISFFWNLVIHSPVEKLACLPFGAMSVGDWPFWGQIHLFPGPSLGMVILWFSSLFSKPPSLCVTFCLSFRLLVKFRKFHSRCQVPNVGYEPGNQIMILKSPYNLILQAEKRYFT